MPIPASAAAKISTQNKSPYGTSYKTRKAHKAIFGHNIPSIPSYQDQSIELMGKQS